MKFKLKSKIKLRALEIDDLEWINKIENDQENWKYSNTISPLSKEKITDYINNYRIDFFETKEIKFIISTTQNSPLGIVDLYDFNPVHRRASVGVIVDKKFQNNGIAKKALILLEEWAINRLGINQFYANVAEENLISIRLFEGLDYDKLCLKKDWNFYNGKFNNEFTFQKIFKK